MGVFTIVNPNVKEAKRRSNDKYLKKEREKEYSHCIEKIREAGRRNYYKNVKSSPAQMELARERARRCLLRKKKYLKIQPQ